jgi:hypothetical protein
MVVDYNPVACLFARDSMVMLLLQQFPAFYDLLTATVWHLNVTLLNLNLKKMCFWQTLSDQFLL